MAITLLHLTSPTEIPDVYIDVSNYGDDEIWIKQHDDLDGSSDFVVMNREMLRQLADWVKKEGL